MIIRLTLVLTAGLVGSMIIFGTNGPDETGGPIEKTVLAPEAEAPADLPVEKVVATSFTAQTPKPTPAPPPVRPVVRRAAVVAVPPADLAVAPQETLDLARIAPSDEAIENAVAQAILPQADIRYVTGSRVNLRAGPSTSDAVVARLARGAETVVLAEAGEGWFRIRDLDTGAEGFMSGDFLSVDAPG
jgi:hypothetical protein